MKFEKNEAILQELKDHFPFTLGASLAAGILVAIFYLINKNYFVGIMSGLFWIMHPSHIFVSAMATTIIYWKYKKSAIKAILIGVGGSIVVGSLSDVVFPWLAGNIFSLKTTFHLPVFEHPIIIIGIALLGSVAGIYFGSFNVAHSLHVFLSIFASLFYILAFSVEMNAITILLISFLVFIAVYIPCCVSDIIFPIFFIRRPCKTCQYKKQNNSHIY